MTAPASLRTVHVRNLGLTAYADVHALQRQLQAARHDPGAADTLLLTEHRPVLTLGRAHTVPDLRVPPATLAARGIAVVQTERGGDITYHGPGQLVAYGIIDLRAWGIGAVDYVTGLEKAVIGALGQWNVAARHVPGARGVWVGERKIASVGVHVSRGVTMHGVALNVLPDTSGFDLINPCGLPDVEMTSLTREAGTPVSVAQAAEAFLTHFARVFACTLNPA